MSKLKWMLSVPPLLTSLTGCVAPSAGISGSQAAIHAKLAPACGQPLALTPGDRSAVADFIDRTAAERGQQLEAAELQRMNDAIVTCRTGVKPVHRAAAAKAK